MNKTNDLSSESDSSDMSEKNKSPSCCFVLIGILVLLVIGAFIVNFINNINPFPREVPNVVTENVSFGKKELEDNGFSNIVVETNTNESPNDSWKICVQSPLSNVKLKKTEKITLYVAEDCKTMDDKGNIVAVKEIVPDVVGKNLSEAKKSFTKSFSYHTVSIEEIDVTGENRSVWDDNNWLVCSQNIASKSIITEDVNVKITYGRDKFECENKKLNAEERNLREVEKTSQGLTDSASYLCDDWIAKNYPELTIQWFMDVRFKEIVDEGNQYGEMWQYNVGVKKDGENVGVLVCKVGGTNSNPILIDAFIN